MFASFPFTKSAGRFLFGVGPFLLATGAARADVGPAPSHLFAMSCTKAHYDNVDPTRVCFGVTQNKKLFIAPTNFGDQLASATEVPGSDSVASGPVCLPVFSAYNQIDKSQILCFYRSTDTRIRASHFFNPRASGRETRHKVLDFGGSLKSAPSCLDISHSPQDRYACFAIGQDDALWMLDLIFDGATQAVLQSSWRKLGGSLNSQPSCVLDGGWASKNVKCLYAEKGTNVFHSLEGSVDGGGWTDKNLLGIVAQAPICSVTPKENFNISCYSKNLLGKVIFREYSQGSGSWSQWQATDTSILGTISGCITRTTMNGSFHGNECFGISPKGTIISFIYNNSTKGLYVTDTGIPSAKAPSCSNVPEAPGASFCLYRDQLSANLKTFTWVTKLESSYEFPLKVY